MNQLAKVRQNLRLIDQYEPSKYRVNSSTMTRDNFYLHNEHLIINCRILERLTN